MDWLQNLLAHVASVNWTQDLVALAQVVMIDVALAGDNAVVVGLAVAGLPSRQQRRAILLGIAGGPGVRIAMGRGGVAIAGNDRAVACGRTSAVVGVLENVSRVAASTSRSRGWGRKDAPAG